MSICAHTTASRVTCEHCHTTAYHECDWTWRTGSGDEWWDCEWRCSTCGKANRDTYDMEETPW